MNNILIRPLLILTLALLYSSLCLAADHLDSPAVQDDPAADINDVYTFMNPNNPNEVILAMTVLPLAGDSSRFSNVVDYRFTIQNTGTGMDYVINCRMPGKKNVTCTDWNDNGIGGRQDRVNNSDGIRVFAGLRDDPFFFDLVGFENTVDMLSYQFTGDDFFTGLNSLAVVVGVDRSLLDADGANAVLTVYGSTHRGESKGLGAADAQVDRMGRPGINTVLIDLLDEDDEGKKDAYNQAEDPATWNQFAQEIEGYLIALDELDGITGNHLASELGSELILAGVLANDRLIIDTAEPTCDAYLAVELRGLGLTGCGGRTLARDVIDDSLGAIVGTGVGDMVDAHTGAFLNYFPFLAEPN